MKWLVLIVSGCCSSVAVCVCECRSSLSMCSIAVTSKQCILKFYHCSSLQVLLPLTLRELHKLRPIQQQVHACMCVHVCKFVCVYVGAWVGGFRCLTVHFVYANDLVFSSCV